MAESKLILHAGAQRVTIEDVANVPTPEPQGRWYPVPHIKVYEGAVSELTRKGYRIRSEQHALSRQGGQYFGVLDLDSEIMDGVSLAVGIRTSIDKSLVMGFVGGSRVFVCDNLAFSSDIAIKRKHTLNGERDYMDRIAESVARLDMYKEAEEVRLEALKKIEFTDKQAIDWILEAHDRALVPATVVLPLIREWQRPRHPEFQDRNGWSMLNSYTEVMKSVQESNLAKFTNLTMNLQTALRLGFGALPEKRPALVNATERSGDDWTESSDYGPEPVVIDGDAPALPVLAN